MLFIISVRSTAGCPSTSIAMAASCCFCAAWAFMASADIVTPSLPVDVLRAWAAIPRVSESIDSNSLRAFSIAAFCAASATASYTSVADASGGNSLRMGSATCTYFCASARGIWFCTATWAARMA